MNKMLRSYDHLTGFGHRVDISELREATLEWPSDVLVDRGEIAQKINRVNTLLDEVEQDRSASSLPFPNYDNIVTKQKTTVKIREINNQPGLVTVRLNGEPVATHVDVIPGGTTVNLTLRPGPNVVFLSLVDPSCNPDPETYRIEFGNNLYGDDYYLVTTTRINPNWTIGLPIITMDGRDYPESARHLHDYLTNHAAGVGDDGIWTIDRNKSEQDKRRIKALGIYTATEGNDPLSPISNFDKDELPMAFFKEGGLGFVRPIPASDNRGSGPNFTGQTRRYGPERKLIPDGHDVQVQATNIGNSKAIVGTSDDDSLRGFNGANYMYGLAGRDILHGYGGDDVMFGGQGIDTVWGYAGDDHLYGNAGDDILNGLQGNDTLTGGLGIDQLRGGSSAEEKDVFVLQKGIAYRGDFVGYFQIGVDRIGIIESDFKDLERFSFSNGTWTNGTLTATGAWIQWNSQNMMFLQAVNASSLSNAIFEYL